MIFYSNDINGGFCQLDPVESGHAVRVLRLNEGDSVEVVDGVGGYYRADIILAHPKKCQLKITERLETNSYRNCKLHLAIAPTKNIDRFEWFLEKSTELGIDRITPLLCDHSERKILKEERLNKVLVSALKQSQKTVLPVLDPLVPFSQFVAKADSAHKFIAYVDQNHENSCRKTYQPGKDLLILIGPEGDFSDNEIELSFKNGFLPVSLGKERLRTETAGVSVCAMFNVLNFW